MCVCETKIPQRELKILRWANEDEKEALNHWGEQEVTESTDGSRGRRGSQGVFKQAEEEEEEVTLSTKANKRMRPLAVLRGAREDKGQEAFEASKEGKKEGSNLKHHISDKNMNFLTSDSWTRRRH